MFEALDGFDTKSLVEALTGDPDNYPRLVTAIARLSEGGLKYERYRAHVAEKKAIIEKELKNASEEGGLSPEAIAKMQHALNMM